ncbi:methyltransferase domain-containing protein [Candidatus Peregrinibacteria bacterium]|nr:methyltransferase domain-containing protein [Candidatus Peregrinibacteria bacterium]
MTHLPTLQERLNNKKMSCVEKYQREFFVNFLRNTSFPPDSMGLSVSCGDGIWDYLVLKNSNIQNIVATDIVDCPVRKEDQNLIRKFGSWEFVQVQPEEKYPFFDSSFDFIFHEDVIEHVKKPFLFLQEQFRVLKSCKNPFWEM